MTSAQTELTEICKKLWRSPPKFCTQRTLMSFYANAAEQTYDCCVSLPDGTEEIAHRVVGTPLVAREVAARKMLARLQAMGYDKFLARFTIPKVGDDIAGACRWKGESAQETKIRGPVMQKFTEDMVVELVE